MTDFIVKISGESAVPRASSTEPLSLLSCFAKEPQRAKRKIAEASRNWHSGIAGPLTRCNASGMNAMIGAAQPGGRIVPLISQPLKQRYGKEN